MENTPNTNIESTTNSTDIKGNMEAMTGKEIFGKMMKDSNWFSFAICYVYVEIMLKIIGVILALSNSSFTFTVN